MGVVRFLLAMSVVFMHYGRLPGVPLLFGSAVVLGFFIISGFYMALVLTEKYKGPGALAEFYTARALRIFPAYFVLLALALISLPVLGRNGWLTASGFWSELASQTLMQQIFTMLPNTFIFGQDLQYYFYYDGGKIVFAENMQQPFRYPNHFLLVPQAWSITLELYFYLIAPFLNRFRTRYLLALTIAGLSLRVYLSALGVNYYPWLYFCFPTTVCFFLMGMLSYRIYAAFPLFWRAPWVGYGSVTALVALPLTQWLWSPWVTTLSRGQLPDGHLFLALAPLLLPGAFEASKNWVWDRRIGELSYSIYLVHFLVYHWTFTSFETETKFGYFSRPDAVLWYNFCTVLAAIALFKLVDEPVDRWRHRRFARRGAKPEMALA